MKKKIITSLIALSMVMSLTACNTDTESNVDPLTYLKDVQEMCNPVPSTVEISEPEDEVTKASYNFMKKFLQENISDKTCIITFCEGSGLKNESPEKKYVYYQVNIDGTLYAFAHEVEDDSVYSTYSGEKLISQFMEKLLVNIPDKSYEEVDLEIPGPHGTNFFKWDMTLEELPQYIKNHQQDIYYSDDLQMSITYRNADSDKLTDIFTHVSAPMFDLPIEINVTNYKQSENFPEFNYTADKIYLKKYSTDDEDLSLDINNYTEMAVDNILISYNKYVDLKVKKKSNIGLAKSKLDSHVTEPHEYVAFYEIDGTEKIPPEKNAYTTSYDGIDTFVSITDFMSSINLLDTKNPQYGFVSKKDSSLSALHLGNDSYYSIYPMDKDILGEYKYIHAE